MLTQLSLSNTNIDESYKLKSVIYQSGIYSDENIASLVEKINVMLDAFSVQFINGSINIKTKKSCMKKIPNYNHNPNFYYMYLAPVFMEFYQSMADTVIPLYNTTYNDNIDYTVYNGMLMQNLVYLINIHTIQDNIIIVNL